MANIFLIDDDDDDIEMITAVLLEIDHSKVTSFNDAERAWNALADTVEPPDYIIMDFKMPKLDGLDMLKRLRTAKCCLHSEIVIFTSMLSPAVIEACKNAGADQIVTKPFSFKDYETAIKAIFEKRRAVDQ